MSLSENSTAAAVLNASTDGQVDAPSISFEFIALGVIVPSRTNRTNFDQVKLAELADSIRASGVHTPIIVRPLPSSRLEETLADRRAGEMLPAFEIVAGERRYRASIMAGRPTIPAIVRPLTDSEAVEAQLIENVQREGLHPLEEAEGYERLMQFGEEGTGTRPSAEEIGKKVGRSKGYVYAKVKLLALGKMGRDAFYAGKLEESIALIVARIPDEKAQEDAVKQFAATDYFGRRMSYRAASDWAQQNKMTRLSAARFKITDATLVPAAGDCRSCPKRTGHDKELYPDVDGADVCTDVACYRVKEEAHAARLRAAAIENGQVIIEGTEAQKLRPNTFDAIAGFVRVDEVKDSPSDKSVRKLLGKDMPAPAVFIDPRDGSVAEVLPKATVAKLLREKGVDTGGRGSLLNDDAEDRQAKAKAEEKYQLTWRAGACEAICAAARVSHKKPAAIGAAVLRILATDMLSGLHSENVRRIAKLVDPANASVGAHHAVYEFIKECNEDLLVPTLYLILGERDVEWMNGASTGKAERLATLAADVEVDLDVVRQVVRDEMKDAAAAKKAKAVEKAAKDAPKAPAKGKAPAKSAAAPVKPAKAPRAPRTTAEEARAGIAAAMQGDKPDDKSGDLLAAAGVAGAFVVNQAVRVLSEGLRGELAEWAGRKGVVRAIDGTLIDVRFKGRKAGLVTFPAGQLTSIKDGEQ